MQMLNLFTVYNISHRRYSVSVDYNIIKVIKLESQNCNQDCIKETKEEELIKCCYLKEKECIIGEKIK